MQEKEKTIKQAGDNEPTKGSETWNEQKVRSYIRYLYKQNERLWQAIQQLQEQLSRQNYLDNSRYSWEVVHQ